MKDYLNKIIKRKEDERVKLKKAIVECDDKEKRQAMQETINALDDEILEARGKLTEYKEKEIQSEKRGTEFEPKNALNVVSEVQTEKREAVDNRGTMEYRSAFKDYIQTGKINKEVLEFAERASTTGTSSDLGVLIPSTVIQEIIQSTEKIYGQLYSRVKKTNLQGGVKYPIGNFSATFKRIKEENTSDRQKAGSTKDYVEFSYKIGEIRLARTLLETILSVPVFEQEFAKVIVKAYVEAMDKEIMTGNDSSDQFIGILTEANKEADSRIPTGNIIEFTDTEMADWTSWQTKLFAIIPLSMRGERPELVLTANTYESNIKTLKDNNNRPLYNETFNPVDGAEISTFKGKPVVFVEEDILKNFNDAQNGEFFGMYWVPEKAYAINSNMEFTVRDYFDEETNQYIKKALVINDGKILDPKYIYLLKKKVTA